MGKEVPAEAVNQMTANFVLPLSKDMPGSKEPFDEVIFVELSRDEAQRSLDEMQRALPRAMTPNCGNSNNQKASSAYPGTAPPVDPRARPPMAGFHPPMDNSYGSYSGAIPGSAVTIGRGAHTPFSMTHQQAPWSVQSLQNPTGSQHQIHSGYPSAPSQHQMHSSYPSNPNQYQVRASYPSTPLPAYGHSTYGSHGTPSPYNPNPYYSETHQSIQAPMSGRNLYQTPGSAEAYGGPGYAAANQTARPLQVHPSTLPTYGSHPVDQLVPTHGSSSMWSSDIYRPYGQHAHGVNPPQYPAPAPSPGAPPNNLNLRLSPWHN